MADVRMAVGLTETAHLTSEVRMISHKSEKAWGMGHGALALEHEQEKREGETDARYPVDLSI